MRRDTLAVFLDTLIFADIHNVNGRDMPVLIDDSENQERETRFNEHTDGMYAADTLIYVSAALYGPLPSYGSVVTLDKRRNYTVVDAVDEYGVYAIRLSANRGRTNNGRLI